MSLRDRKENPMSKPKVIKIYITKEMAQELLEGFDNPEFSVAQIEVLRSEKGGVIDDTMSISHGTLTPVAVPT